MKAPSAPSSSIVCGEPAIHFTVNTLEAPGATPDTLRFLPSSLPSPMRTPITFVTPGTALSGSSSVIGNGEKLFWAVTA